MKYKEVLALFDNRPSTGTVYELMREAANADGFEHGKGPDVEQRDRLGFVPETPGGTDRLGEGCGDRHLARLLAPPAGALPVHRI